MFELANSSRYGSGKKLCYSGACCGIRSGFTNPLSETTEAITENVSIPNSSFTLRLKMHSLPKNSILWWKTCKFERGSFGGVFLRTNVRWLLSLRCFIREVRWEGGVKRVPVQQKNHVKTLTDSWIMCKLDGIIRPCPYWGYVNVLLGSNSN